MSENDEKYDVIVIGAGPSGSTVANLASSNGLKTALLDVGNIGRDKPCAGFVPNSVIREFKIPDEIIDRKIYRLRSYYGELEAELQIDKSGSVLRTVFDRYLLERAIDAGTTFIPNTRVIDLNFKKGKIDGVVAQNSKKNIFHLDAKVTVDAEGGSAILARKIGLLKKWQKKAVTRQYIMTIPEPIEHRFDDDAIETYWDIEGSGYAWIFPKKDLLYVGIGIEMPPLVRDIRARLDNFIKMHPVASKKLNGYNIIKSNGGVVVTSCPYSPTYMDNFLVVGEAAGWAGPLYGGGIDYGMFSAKAAAETIVGAIDSEDTSSARLSTYEKICWEINGSYLKRENLVKRLALRNQRGKKALVKNFNTPIVKKVVRCSMSRSGKITIPMRLNLMFSLLIKYLES